MSGIAGAAPVDLSPAVTIVAFDPIVPPLRIPVPAGEDDDPSKGEWVLAFKDQDSWRRGWLSCERKIAQQCEDGARMGCSISAANVCQVPWWKHALIFIRAAKLEEGERDVCEEREMMACLAGSKETCSRYARDTCVPVFAEARVAEENLTLDPRFTGPPSRRRWSRDTKKQRVHTSSENNPGALVNQLDSHKDSKSWDSDTKRKSTNYKGRKLMTRESIQMAWNGPTWSDMAVEGDSSRGFQSPTNGWEGGLIRPKFESQSVQSGREELAGVGKESIWLAIEHRVRNLFKDVRM